MSGSPPISVAWFRNGLKLVSGEKHQISFSDNLCILEVNSLSDSDAGTYTCKATNIAGSDECSAVLTVQGQYMMVKKHSKLFCSLFLLILPIVFCKYAWEELLMGKIKIMFFIFSRCRNARIML